MPGEIAACVMEVGNVLVAMELVIENYQDFKELNLAETI